MDEEVLSENTGRMAKMMRSLRRNMSVIYSTLYQ